MNIFSLSLGISNYCLRRSSNLLCDWAKHLTFLALRFLSVKLGVSSDCHCHFHLELINSTLFDSHHGTPLQYSCLETPMDRGAWQAVVHGATKSQTWLSDLTFTFHLLALEKEMATHSSVLAWRIPRTEEPGGLPSMGSHRVGHDWSDLAAAAWKVLGLGEKKEISSALEKLPGWLKVYASSRWGKENGWVSSSLGKIWFSKSYRICEIQGCLLNLSGFLSLYWHFAFYHYPRSYFRDFNYLSPVLKIFLFIFHLLPVLLFSFLFRMSTFNN